MNIDIAIGCMQTHRLQAKELLVKGYACDRVQVTPEADGRCV